MPAPCWTPWARGWDAAVAAAQNITHDRLGAVRGYEDKAFQEYIKGLRDEWKDACTRIQTSLLAVDGEAEQAAPGAGRACDECAGRHRARLWARVCRRKTAAGRGRLRGFGAFRRAAAARKRPADRAGAVGRGRV